MLFLNSNLGKVVTITLKPVGGSNYDSVAYNTFDETHPFSTLKIVDYDTVYGPCPRVIIGSDTYTYPTKGQEYNVKGTSFSLQMQSRPNTSYAFICELS